MIQKLSQLLLIALLGVSCGNQPTVKQTPSAEEKFPVYDESVVTNTTSGILGIYEVPEVLTISKMDSASMLNVAQKVAETYSVLGAEMDAIHAEPDGVPGQIMYNNDSLNFIFECFSPIKKMPGLQPKKCKFVMLEQCNMLVYNFYGPYSELYKSYDSLRNYIANKQLVQVGQVRELYISDPTTEANSAKWLTRVMVPVARLKKEEGQ